MGQTIYRNDIYIRRGDPLTIDVTTDGSLVARVGDIAKFIVKESNDSIEYSIEKDIVVTTDGEISIELDSSDTELLEVGNYVWSVVHYSAGNHYTIIPDRPANFPSFSVKDVLLNE